MLCAQFAWFDARYPQPTIYDAGQYAALSRQITWLGPLPILEGGGLRTYAYPLVLSAASQTWEVVYRLQAVGLVALIVVLRRRLLPPDLRVDLCLAACLAALPILVPYATVLLADLPGAICLQLGLLLLSLALSAALKRSLVLIGVGGLLLGTAIQMRPAYLPFAGLVVGGVVWSAARRLDSRRAFGSSLISVVVLAAGIALPSAPTLVANAREEGRFGIVPAEGMERLRGYQLTLGLWLDRWSSNPPPIEERERVAVEWRQRGWAILPIPPYPYPTVKDYWNEVARDPLHAAGQFARHVYYGFAKSELFPYAGQPSALVRAWIWVCNWVLLGLGLCEMIRLARRGTIPTTRRFAMLNLGLAAFLVLTCGLVVAEERFTLAVYPTILVFAAGVLARWTRSCRNDALSPPSA